MVRSLKDIQAYRRQYYLKNKEYLVRYQKWYYSTRRYQAGIIEEDEIYPKPKREQTYSEKKKKDDKLMKKRYGTFTIVFE